MVAQPTKVDPFRAPINKKAVEELERVARGAPARSSDEAARGGDPAARDLTASRDMLLAEA